MTIEQLRAKVFNFGIGSILLEIAFALMSYQLYLTTGSSDGWALSGVMIGVLGALFTIYQLIRFARTQIRVS